jgi:hypothetical protein
MLGTSKGGTLGRDNGRNRNVTRRTRIEPYRKMTGHEIAKQFFCRITTGQALDLVEGSTPSKTEKETANRGGTGNVEATASLARMNEERMKVRN